MKKIEPTPQIYQLNSRPWVFKIAYLFISIAIAVLVGVIGFGVGIGLNLYWDKQNAEKVARLEAQYDFLHTQYLNQGIWISVIDALATQGRASQMFQDDIVPLLRAVQEENESGEKLPDNEEQK